MRTILPTINNGPARRTCTAALFMIATIGPAACNGDDSGQSSTGATATVSTSATTATTAPTSSSSGGETESDSGSGSQGDSTSTSDGQTTGSSSSGSSTTSPLTTTDASSSTSTGTDTESSTGSTGGDCEGNMMGAIDFSYLWVANSGQNTVSKIDTVTLLEVGRYKVHPDGIAGGSPSRTSVNLHGDMAVANRCNQQDPVAEGCAGVTKIAARVEDCIDLNNNGQIETSTGSNNVLPYGQDECVLWHTPLSERSNRPVAWTAGELNPNTCKYENAKVWTATSNAQDPNSVKVYLLNGEDGTIEEEIVVKGWQGMGYAVYGGAVDSKDDFWFVGGYSQQLGHIRRADLTYEVIAATGTPYGTMVDSKDRPWLLNGSMHRYDPMSQSWQDAPCPFPCTSITQDGDGNVWIGGVANGDIRLIKVDADTMQITDMITKADIPDLGNSWGLATDVEGYLWAVEMGTQAYKIDRTDYSYEIFNNNTSMYTYSDMTGFGLVNVIPQ